MYVYKENKIMKKIFASAVLVSSLLIVGNMTTSCSKVEDLIDEISVPIPFTIPLSFEAQIPVATADTNEYVTYPDIAVNLDVDAKIKEKYPSLSANNLKSAKLDNFSIDYLSSTGGTKLDALKDAKLYLKTPDLPELLVAESLNNVNPNTINFTPTANTELISYLKSKQNSFILKIRGSKVALDAVKIKVNSGFKIEVGL